VGGTPTTDQESRIQREYQPVQPTYAQSTTIPGTRAKKPSLDDMGPGTDRAVPARDAEAVSRIRKPTLDEMGSARNRPIPARDHSPSPREPGGEGRLQPRRAAPPSGGEGSGIGGSREEGGTQPRKVTIDPRTKAGAYGEAIKGPHKPTLDEMGPHAERGLPVAGKTRPVKYSPADFSPRHAGGVQHESGEGRGWGEPPREKKKHRHGRPRKTGRPGA
jgi:excinuclease ABC subunit B